MPITSQIRLQQLTGSLQSLKPVSVAAASAMNDVDGAAAADLEDVLKYYAQAVANVHGNRDIAAQAPGSFSQAIYSDTDRARLLGRLEVSEGSSMSDNTSTTGLSASTTTLAYSSLSENLSSSEIIKLSDGSNFMLFSVTSGASAGATSVGVEFVADGSEVNTLSSVSSTRRNVSVTKSEWAGVRAPDFVSEQDLSIRAVGANKKITLEANRSSNDGIVLSNTNAAGAIQLQVAGAVSLTAHDDRLEASLATDATGKGSVASLKVLGGLALAKKAFIGDDIALDTDGKKVQLGNTAGTALLIDHLADRTGTPSRIHQSGSIDLQVGSSQKVKVHSDAGSTVLSGSAGIAFAADGGFGFGGSTEGGLIVGLEAESAAYRAITDAGGVAFGGTTSILAAFDKLNSKIQAGEPTLFKFEAPANHTPAPAVTVVKVAGDAANLETSVPVNKLDVYVNGQLMLEGSGKDYQVTAQDVITFEFNIAGDDVVIAIDRS